MHKDKNIINIINACLIENNYPYEIIESLGNGCFGCVYKAKNHKSGEEVALKFGDHDELKKIKGMNQLKALEYFKNEATFL